MVFPVVIIAIIGAGAVACYIADRVRQAIGQSDPRR